MKSIEYLRHHRKFQSTPPHGRRRLRGWHPDLVICVSIHASAREATYWLHNSASFFQFQSTPPHGRRPGLCLDYIKVTLSFNPRLRTGGDKGFHFKNGFFFDVSIHASAREATWVAITTSPFYSLFQSTPPHGRRHLSSLNVIGILYVSIHASAREATNFRDQVSVFHVMFQSTPPHGRRLVGLQSCVMQCHVSIHASAREATSFWPGAEGDIGFNPRLRTGGD